MLDQTQVDSQQAIYDYLTRTNPAYVQEQIDQMILTPEARATIITKKIPKMVKHPIYLLDGKGEKIALTDEAGAIKVNELGEIIYIIKDYEEKQEGWQSEREIVPASEIFNIDNATSNISIEAVKVILRLMFLYNDYLVKHQKTDLDYSCFLHQLRNDILAIYSSSKSYNGGTVQAIKTFINKTDAKQWVSEPQEEKKKGSILSGIFGGTKKVNAENKEFTAFK